MLRMLLSALFMMFFAVGCGPRYVDYFPNHDDGTPKPKVALLPILDSSNGKLPWNISEELSQSIYDDLMDSGKLYVLPPNELGVPQNISADCFGGNLDFLRNFHDTDFVVALELIKHSTTPCKEAPPPGGAAAGYLNCRYVLDLQMRVRILDIRNPSNPRTILYEITKTSYKISPPESGVNYDKITWSSSAFRSTPCGIAHQRLVQNLTARMEDIIRSAN